MRRFSYFSAIWRAPLGQRDLFRDAAQNWRGINFFYLLALLVVMWILVYGPTFLFVTNGLHTWLPEALRDFPPLTIENGRLTTNATQPAVAIYEKDTKPLLVIDTTGNTTRPSDLNARILITKDQWIEEIEPPNTRSIPLANIWLLHGSYTRESIIQFISRFRYMAFIAIVLLALVYRIITALIIAAIARAMAKGHAANLSYAAFLRVTILAQTPSILALSLLFFIIPSIPILFITDMFITGAYTAFALKTLAASPVLPSAVSNTPIDPDSPWPP